MASERPLGLSQFLLQLPNTIRQLFVNVAIVIGANIPALTRPRVGNKDFTKNGSPLPYDGIVAIIPRGLVIIRSHIKFKLANDWGTRTPVAKHPVEVKIVIPRTPGIPTKLMGNVQNGPFHTVHFGHGRERPKHQRDEEK